MINEIEEHFNQIEILDIQNYRFTNLTERRKAEFKIKNNYFLLLLISGYFDENLLNIVGGCCGTSYEHIRQISLLAKKYKPRKL